MIERFTMKFAPAVSHKDLEKALHESGDTPNKSTPNMDKNKARIELIGDFDDVKKLSALLKNLSKRKVSD